MRHLHIGIDDTDSPKGMCTTYVGTIAIDRLKKIGCELIGYPKLIRLNPCWPKKTRGNCAVAFEVGCPGQSVSKAKNIVLGTVEELAEKDSRTNSGVSFFESTAFPRELHAFSSRVVKDIVELSEAEELARKAGIEIHKFKHGDGIIGAIAAMSHPLDLDWTYELISYRTPENRGRPRRIDPSSVIEMDKLTAPSTFDNLDPFTGEIRVTPHTPCPILYGIRGESLESVRCASEIVKAQEPIERIQIFKTNQGTDEHLSAARIDEVRPLRSYSIKGVVRTRPRVIPGGHVIFELDDETGTIDCAAYEPTRIFREVVKQLLPGDEVVVHGGVKDKPGLPRTLNLEKIEVLDLTKQVIKQNPKCPKCGKRMKSEGRGKGYSCKRCGERAPPTAVEVVEVPRKIRIGKFEVPPRARRHLARPLQRELLVKNLVEF